MQVSVTLLSLFPRATISYGKIHVIFKINQVCVFSRYFRVISENTKPVLINEMIDFF